MRNLSILAAIVLVICTLISALPLEKTSAQASLNLAPAVLYAGTSDPGGVYQYLGDDDWKVIGSETELDDAYAVTDLAEYQGQLYAGVTTGYGGYSGVGRVYVREDYDGTSWTRVGDNMDHAVISLAVYKGDLYAGTGRGDFRLYKYTPGDTNCGIQNWTRCVSGFWNGVRALHVSYFSGEHVLLMGDTFLDRIAQWDGDDDKIVLNAGGSCIYDFEDYGNYVYGSAYHGRLWRSSDGTNWSLAPGFASYYDGHMWELERFKGSLYMSYGNGELWESDGSERGTCKYTAPDGIISMATDDVNLYFGTGGDAVGYGCESHGTANIYRYDGNDVQRISNDDQFGDGVQVLYSPEKVVVGYVGYTSYCSGTGVLDGKRLTHAIEAFASVELAKRNQGYLNVGGLEGRAFVKEALENNMIPLVSINGKRANDWATVVMNPARRTTLISTIVELVGTGEYMGVDVDLEGLYNFSHQQLVLNGYRDFVIELRQALDADENTASPRRLLTVTVGHSDLPYCSIGDLATAADYVMLMGYDYNLGVPQNRDDWLLPLGPWESAGLCVRKDLDRVLRDFGHPERTIYLLPFYARWGNSGNDALAWRSLSQTERDSVMSKDVHEDFLEKQAAITVTINSHSGKQETRLMWWTDQECVTAKVRRALFENALSLEDGSKANIRGVGAWQLCHDTEDAELATALWDAARGS